jgi:hypothetical protein
MADESLIAARHSRETASVLIAGEVIILHVMPDLIRHPGHSSHLIKMDSGSSPE